MQFCQDKWYVYYEHEDEVHKTIFSKEQDAREDYTAFVGKIAKILYHQDKVFEKEGDIKRIL
tara:strand:+ start:416 stop:601 length:186 start_codon:yes stop_codon:yes gene_type:complete